jgi:N-methylhydantoinase A
VTDADVVLGYIAPERFLGGRMALRADLAERAIRTHLAETLFAGNTLSAAAGIRQVIDSQMADLIRKTTLERGYDPRDFVMMAYGGSGPAHAASYGAEVGVSEIIVPYFATVHSAYGAAISDVRFSLSFSDPLTLPTAPDRIEAIYGEMEERGGALLAEADVRPAHRRYERWVEARYRRQVHHVRIPVPSRFDEEATHALSREFHEEYERLFGPGSGLRDAGIELVNYGVEAIGAVDKPPTERASSGTAPNPRAKRPTYCPRRRAMVDTSIYDGPALPADTVIAGPAVIEHPGTNIVVLDRQHARIDEFRHTHIIL